VNHVVDAAESLQRTFRLNTEVVEIGQIEWKQYDIGIDGTFALHTIEGVAAAAGEYQLRAGP
jgi:hypothetical protein